MGVLLWFPLGSLGECMYQAMARRYRPQTFDDVIGQGHVARTLRNAITAGRVAHAYLFCGPHGCGKTSMARIFAKALNCTGGPSADIPADCPIVADISSGQDPDVIEIDGASNNGVEQVRTLREQAAYVPARARFKIYIIDEVHMLSVAAFNALLKTLEEPPPHVKFILATTEPHKLLETVLSRCQRFDFRLVPAPEIAGYLKSLCGKENVPADADALDAVAAFSGGSMRDALVLLDQLISFCPDGMTRADVERVRGVAGIETVVGIFEAVARHDCAGALAFIDSVSRMGTGAGEFLDQLIEYGRDLMRVCVTKSLDGVSAYGPARDSLSRQANSIGLEEALLILDVFSTARVRVRGRALSNPYVPLEMAVARLAGLEGISGLETVIARIESIAQSGALAGDADVRIVPETMLQHTATASSAETGSTIPAATASAVVTPSAPVQTAAAVPEKKTESLTPAAVRPSTEPEPAPVAAATSVPQSAVTATAETVSEASVPAAPAPQTAVTPDGLAEPAIVDEDVVDDEPPAESDASAEPAGPSAEADPAGFLRTHWELFRNALAETEPKDVRYIHDMFAQGCEDTCLVLRIPANGKWLFGQIEEPDRRARITAALSKAIGRPMTFRLLMEDAPEADPADESWDGSGDAGDTDDGAAGDDSVASAAPMHMPEPPPAPVQTKPQPADNAMIRDIESFRDRQREARRDKALQRLITRFDAQLLNIEDLPARK